MQLKEPTLADEYEWVYFADPAIDREHEDHANLWAEAKQSGDWSKIHLKEGQKPVIWTLKHLRGVVRRRVQDLLNADFRAGRDEPSTETLYHAARFAIVRAEGLTNHRRMPAEIDRFTDSDWGRELSVTPAWMELLEDMQLEGGITGRDLVNEIGAEAIIRLLPGKS